MPSPLNGAFKGSHQTSPIVTILWGWGFLKSSSPDMLSLVVDRKLTFTISIVSRPLERKLIGEDKLACNTFASFSRLTQPFFWNKCYSDSHRYLLIFTILKHLILTILACVLSAFLEQQIYAGPGSPILQDHPGPVGLKCRVPTSCWVSGSLNQNQGAQRSLSLPVEFSEFLRAIETSQVVF